MENIFEGSKFGDKFLTKNNHIAVLLGVYDNYVCICTDDGTIESNINLDGTLKYEPLEGYDYTIVSRYQEPIDEEKLDELAEKTWVDKDYVVAILPQKEGDLFPIYVAGFSDCYHKIMEE